jgi:predicted RecB family nuclease
MRDRVRREAQKTIEAAYPEGEVQRDVQVTASLLKRGAEFLQVRIEDSSFFLTMDGLKNTPGACALGEFHYVPVWCYEGDRIRQEQKQLVAILGIILADLQERVPAVGLVYHGRECKVTRVQLTDALQKKVRRVLLEIRELHRSGEPPRLMLNSHCRMCEFRQRCHEQAMKDDDLSLLMGMGEKEIRKYNGKGIFTTTQLSCTFRLRKRGKRVQRLQRPHYFALQAAAKRDQKVYVLEPPSFPTSPVQIYLDVEGDLERSFVYLLSMLVVENGADSWHSLWADTQEQELDLFQQFLDLVRKYDDFMLFHYGSYETSFFKRMQKVLGRTTAIAKLMDCSCNVLSIIHSHIYFPLYSNGLKDVGRYLGTDWSDPKADGLQSIFWRTRWEETGDVTFKRKLEMYNREDCLALRRVAVFLRKACATDSPEDVSVTDNPRGRIIEPAWPAPQNLIYML